MEPAGEQQTGTSSRAQQAAEKRKRIMEQMALQQRSFLQKHRDELDSIASSPVAEDERSKCTHTQAFLTHTHTTHMHTLHILTKSAFDDKCPKVKEKATRPAGYCRCPQP